MRVLLPGLTPVQLEKLADALERGQSEDDIGLMLRRISFGSSASATVDQLRECLATSPVTAVAAMLKAVAAERQSGMQNADRRLELVWTGPERDRTATRDTAVVVRDLFLSAEHDVLVAGYALYDARSIFEPLAARMTLRPTIRVRLVVNVNYDRVSSADEALFAFRGAFRKHHWPDVRLPTVYYDPRALHSSAAERAVMHAKCVAVDGERCFVTSANLTEAAQARNIELGVVVNDGVWTQSVIRQFDELIAHGDLRELVI